MATIRAALERIIMRADPATSFGQAIVSPDPQIRDRARQIRHDVGLNRYLATTHGGDWPEDH